MNILWISGSRIVGGAERVTFQILGELRARDHRIAALYRQSPKFDAELHRIGIEAHPARLGGSLNLLAPLAIARALKVLRPHLALVTTSDEWVWASLVPRAGVGTRLVLARHMALALPAKVRRLANRRADAVIAVSEAARASLLRKPGIEPARLHVISNPVRFPIRAQPPPLAARIESRRSLNLPAEGRWIGFFGGGEPQKGIRDVLIAVRQLQDCRGGCHLMVCGRPAKDSRLPSVDQMAAAYGLGGVVHDMGSIEEVETAITACDVIAIATHASLSESAPLVALEAMACGTPLAAYAVGGIPELLGSPEEGGVLVAPENPEDLARQLRRLLTDTDLAMRGAMAALERARERFAPELAVDRYEALFTQLCGLPNQAHLADRPGD